MQGGKAQGEMNTFGQEALSLKDPYQPLPTHQTALVQ